MASAAENTSGGWPLPIARDTSVRSNGVCEDHRGHHDKPRLPAVAADRCQERSEGLAAVNAAHPAPGATVGIGVNVLAVEVAGGVVLVVAGLVVMPIPPAAKATALGSPCR